MQARLIKLKLHLENAPVLNGAILIKFSTNKLEVVICITIGFKPGCDVINFEIIIIF